ncbi:nucleotidyltransferase domain-containing protein [Geobacillus sp. C56-T2]|nr:nucleotidyltransferase domain-containing protein [Geobacillus sp. C56-T2]
MGVVLGGSRARATNHATSDIDTGIYYDVSADFDIKAVSKIATRLAD